MIYSECMLAGFCTGLFLGTVAALLGYLIRSAFNWMMR